MLDRVFKAFSYPDFRRMWLGACTSSVGTWMQKLAQSWLVLELSNSPRLLGLDAFLGEIPIFLFSLLGGVIADRVDRRKLLLGSQFLQMSCAFLLAALLATHTVQIWHILCLSFLTGFAQAFGGPAYQALIPSLVPKADLQNAIALNSIQFNLARVIGPVLGGIALSKLGSTWCFTLNGISFVAVIISLLWLPARLPVIPKNETIYDSLKQGLRFVKGSEAMRALIVLAFCMTILGLPLLTFLPVFAKDVLHQGKDAFSILLALSGMGAVTGALIVAAAGNRGTKGRDALLLLSLLGITTVIFSQTRHLWQSSIVIFVSGAALIGVFAFITSLVQLITEDNMRGRVMSVYNVFFRGGMPFGSLITGNVIPILGTSMTLAINGTLLTALGFYLLLVHRRVARL